MKKNVLDSILTLGVEEIIVKEDLYKKLQSGKKLRIKLGVDPTRPDIHLGHAVTLWTLKALQDMGHKIIFLIGDYTTRIGDPSGRNKTRPILDDATIKRNAKSYLDQVGKILDIAKTEVCFNSEWYKDFSFTQIIEVTSSFTVARIIERDDFNKRLKAKTDIGLHELLYPVMQAYDSVKLKADVEIGGTDQKFNMLAGRELQKKMGMAQQNIIQMKLLVGTDGVNKMSKSLDNYIGIREKPSQQFGKIMSIPDSLIEDYAILAARMDDKKLKEVKSMIKNNPRDAKALVAKTIVELYYPEEGGQAEADFNRQFKDKEIPFDIPTVKIKNKNLNLVDLMLQTKLVASKSEARRLIEQRGVKIDKAIIGDNNETVAIYSGMILQVGKRKFVKII